MPTITEQTQTYIAEHPSVKECLSHDLINFSALARQIEQYLGVKPHTHFDAIVVAARRYSRSLTKSVKDHQRVQEVLKKSRVEIKNKVFIAVLQSTYPYKTLAQIEQRIKDKGEPVHLIESPSGTTLIASMEFEPLLNKHFKQFMIKQHRNVVEIVIKSPQDIESTSGIVSYIYSLLGENGVNIIETSSSWTDTIVLIEERDVTSAMRLLRF